MNTVKIRWLGAKKVRVVDLPVGLASLSEKTGEVACNPVGEFPAGEARKLLSIPGAGALFVLEDEYQAKLNPKSEVARELKKEAQRERGKKLAEIQAKKRAAKKTAAPAKWEEEPPQDAA